MYENWNISEEARLLHEQAFVVDTTLPLMPGSKFSNLFSALNSMQRNGFNYVSLTIATDIHTTMETIEASKEPVVVSHGNVAAVNSHQRCYKDDQIKAIANKGGVFGVTGFGLFLGKEKSLVEQYVRNIDHIVQLVGPKHAGIGLDYVYDMDAFVRLAESNHEKYPTEGGYFDNQLDQVEINQIPQITEALLKLGYSDENVRDVLGDNWLRIFSQVWK